MNFDRLNPNSNRTAPPHLSEDELDEVLMGVGSAAASAHLRVCDPCGERLAAFQVPMAQFNQATLSWSEQRSNTISRDLSRHRITPRLTLGTVWSSAAAFALALAFGFTAIVQRPAETPQTAGPAIAQAESQTGLQSEFRTESATATLPDQQPELAYDNAMLAAIDSEITTPAPAQFGLYETAAARQEKNPDTMPRVSE